MPYGQVLLGPAVLGRHDGRAGHHGVVQRHVPALAVGRGDVAVARAMEPEHLRLGDQRGVDDQLLADVVAGPAVGGDGRPRQGVSDGIRRCLREVFPLPERAGLEHQHGAVRGLELAQERLDEQGVVLAWLPLPDAVEDVGAVRVGDRPASNGSLGRPQLRDALQRHGVGHHMHLGFVHAGFHQGLLVGAAGHPDLPELPHLDGVRLGEPIGLQGREQDLVSVESRHVGPGHKPRRLGEQDAAEHVVLRQHMVDVGEDVVERRVHRAVEVVDRRLRILVAGHLATLAPPLHGLLVEGAAHLGQDRGGVFVADGRGRDAHLVHGRRHRHPRLLDGADHAAAHLPEGQALGGP